MMIGDRFGKWVVIREVETSKPGRHFECQCKCGEFAVIPATTLRAGRSTQCKECMYATRFDPTSMVGRKFGKWTVLSPAEIRNRCWIFRVQCECGLEKECYGSDLRGKKTTQCTICHNRENAQNNIKHGGHGSLMYKVWSSMKSRCSNPTDRAYRWYGSRGIKVCERWQKFENFLADMGERPDGMTIDRINNDGDYEPGNCRWVSHFENCQNRRKRSPRMACEIATKKLQ